MIKLRINEIAEQLEINMSQLQRGTGLTMGMVRRYWRNDVESVSLVALTAILRVFQKKNPAICYEHLFYDEATATQESKP